LFFKLALILQLPTPTTNDKLDISLFLTSIVPAPPFIVNFSLTTTSSKVKELAFNCNESAFTFKLDIFIIPPSLTIFKLLKL